MTLGKKQRTDTVDFLGNKYVQSTCPSCKKVFEHMSIDKNAQLCGYCANPQDIDIDKLDLSGSHDDCMRNYYAAVRKEYDKIRKTD